jgi:recombination protein RecA
MALKSLEEKLKALDKISDGINKKAGRTVMGRISNNEEMLDKLTIRYIPTVSQNINATIGGGFPRRRTTIVAGKPDSGKTSLLLETIGMNMKKDPSFVAGWLESEGSLKIDYLTKVFGIDPDRFVYVEHDRIEAGEGALDQVEAIMGTGALDMMVINSLKCLVPAEEFQKSMKQVQVGAQARMNSKMMRKFTSLVTESDTAFVIVTHLTTQIGSMSRDPLIVSGGNAILYASALTLDLRKQSLGDGDPITKEEGSKIGLTVKKNHCMPEKNPYVKTEYFVIFGEGTEIYLEALQNAQDQDIILGSGWMREPHPDDSTLAREWNGITLKWQGKANFRKFCIENPEYFEDLLNRISGTVVVMTDAEISEIKEEEKAIEATLGEEMMDIKPKKSKKTKTEA